MTRHTVRAALAGGVLAFTWYTVSIIQDAGAAAWPLVTVDVLLLTLVLRAATVASRRRDRRG